jgi:hypothetical protein
VAPPSRAPARARRTVLPKEESSLRKLSIGAVVGVLSLALAAVAFALTNNRVEYGSTIKQTPAKYKGKTVKTLPQNLSYTGVLHVSTSDGGQPNTAPLTEVFFAKEIQNNGKAFASCSVADIDGKPAIPAKCNKALVGGGTASSLLGKPGQQNSVRTDLTVKAYNGPKGKSLLLVVSGGPIKNRVIDGPISSAPAPFAKKVGFAVPKDLQEILGNQIALTDFSVTVNGTVNVKRKLKVKGKKKNVPVKTAYLTLTKCPKSKLLPVKAIVHFNDDNNQPSSNTVTSEGTMSCK